MADPLLTSAIRALRGELAGLVGDDEAPRFAAQLDEYLRELETEEERAPIIRAQILDLFRSYPRAHQRLVEVMDALADTPRAVRSRSDSPGWAAETRRTALTRYSDVVLPREAELGVPVALVVRVTVDRYSPEAKKLELQASPDKPVELTVIARADGLELRGSNLRRLTVPLAGDSDPVHFELVGRRLGTALVTVDFFQDARYLATVTAETQVRPAGETIRAGAAPARGVLGFDEGWEDPDLLIRIYESRGVDGMPRYRFEVTSRLLGLLHFDAGEVALPRQAEAWVEEQMKALTEMARSISTASDKVLASFGEDLYGKLCPPILQEFFWSRLHERSDIETLLLVSSEPWVPWEMIKPWRRVGNNIEEAPHWCERFAMGRWLSGQQPPLILPRGELALIAPTDTGLNAGNEGAMLARIGLEVRNVTPRLAPVLDFLESSGCPGVHAVSHGIFNLADSDQAELWLEKANAWQEDSREKLYPKHINGKRLRFGGARPAVFFNACNCGRSDFTYWGLGGWATALVARAGSSAFVAPFWEVEDDRALLFAESYYTHLLAGKSCGEAVRLARMEIKDTGNPTWLAYCLYGHPAATLA